MIPLRKTVTNIDKERMVITMYAIERLAARLRDVPKQIGVTTGRVVSVDPLVVSVGELFLARYPRLYYTAGMRVEVGDEVIVIASQDNQYFYCVGKAARA